MNVLENYSWPGNVRELENIIERSVVISQGNQLELGEWIAGEDAEADEQQASTLEQVEREYIIKTLEKTNWRVSGQKAPRKY
jgi:transcriptional regulator of acetoin/glycerol metabolism